MAVFSPEEDEELRRLLAERSLSFSAIQARMNERFGIFRSRNSYIGRATRMQMKKSGVGKKVRRRHRISIPKPPETNGHAIPLPIPELPQIPIDTAPVSLLDLTRDHCKYPVTDAPWDQPRYCGRQVIGYGPYCEDHADICFARAFTAAEKRAWREINGR